MEELLNAAPMFYVYAAIVLLIAIGFMIATPTCLKTESFWGLLAFRESFYVLA